MDRNERTAHLIKELNLYKRYPERRGAFIKATCDYYDAIKIDELTSNDLNFLRYIANEAGVPQYYQLLENKYQAGKTINKESVNLLSMSSFINEASLIVKDEMLHKYQKEVTDLFRINTENRYILSAPTSFGKTFTVYTIIKKMGYSNILLVFPTISLLSENLLKLQNDEFFTTYKIHSLSEIKKEEFEKLGIIFTDTDSALKEYPDLFKQYFAKLVPPTDNKLAALNSAVWSGGTFIYVPKGVKVDVPLQTYFRINNENTGQFERTLIIVDEGASVH